MTEYGVGTLAGLHSMYSDMWAKSTSAAGDTITEYSIALAPLSAKQVWNFAVRDFTGHYARRGGNRKRDFYPRQKTKIGGLYTAKRGPVGLRRKATAGESMNQPLSGARYRRLQHG